MKKLFLLITTIIIFSNNTYANEARRASDIAFDREISRQINYLQVELPYIMIDEDGLKQTLISARKPSFKRQVELKYVLGHMTQERLDVLRELNWGSHIKEEERRILKMFCTHNFYEKLVDRMYVINAIYLDNNHNNLFEVVVSKETCSS